MAVCLHEATTPEFVAYQQQVVKNAAHMAQHMVKKGYELATSVFLPCQMGRNQMCLAGCGSVCIPSCRMVKVQIVAKDGYIYICCMGVTPECVV